MNILRNQQGVALITVLLFSMVAFGVVTGAYYMVTSQSKLSGMQKQYISEVEVARSVASFVIAELKNGSATCGTNNCCPTPPCVGGMTSPPNPTCQASKTFDIHGAVCTALGRPGCQNITACLMSQTDYIEINPAKSGADKGVNVSVYSINVKTQNASGETADIDFVLRM